MRRPVLALALAAVLGLALAPCARAHAALTRADPRVGATVTSSPGEVRMWFSEPLEPAFSAASIASFRRDLGEAKAVVDANDRRQLVLPLPRPLPPGRYRVQWAVVSVDGHRTEGDFPFTVAGGR